MSINEEIEMIYDCFVNSYKACCEKNETVMLVLEGLTEKEQNRTISAAKSGWVDRLKLLDKKLAEMGEP